MTKERGVKSNKIPSKNILFIINTSILILSFSVSALLSSQINLYVKSGLYLCFNVVIGSVFPFMIITDMILASADIGKYKLPRKVFERLFNINGYAASAFICGAVCGFPLGVKVASDFYKNGIISKAECERLIGFCNNTGPAFVISGIGLGLRKSLADGAVLYIAMILSALLTGIILGIGKEKTSISPSHTVKKFDLTESVKKASISTLNVCGFVVLFSVICGLLSLVIKDNTVYSVLTIFLEVSNSSKLISSNPHFSMNTSLALTSFAISFSGISVHMQAKSFLTDTDISIIPAIFSKLMQASISSILIIIYEILHNI